MTTTIVEMFRAQVAASGDRPALRTKASGQWVARSWREWDETSLALAAGLIDLGVRPSDRVGLFAGTRREWAEADVATVRAGAVTVPLYPQTTPLHAAHILGDSESTVAFAEDPLQVEKLFDPRVRDRLKNLRRIVYFDARRRLEHPDAQGRLEVRLEDVVPRSERSRVMSYAELLEAGRRVIERDESTVRAREEGLVPDDLASIVYTSGTTGVAKGVCLRHANFAFECENVATLLDLNTNDEQLLFLPLAHIFAKVLLMAAVRVGFATAFASSPVAALDEATEVHPTFFGAVPPVYERIYADVHDRLRADSRLRRRATAMAFDVGQKVATLREQGRSPGPVLEAQYRLANMSVLEKVRHRFGRRLRFAISGGAPLSREIAQWFHACGVLLLDGYGLTETTAATHMNLGNAYRLGTVGRALPGVEAETADDGEVLIRGGNVMAGYFKLADETAAVVDAAGWLHTGDLGRIDADGYLTITDRKSDVITTPGGQRVAPQMAEGLLRRSAWVSNAVVCGDGRPYLVALISLSESTAREWAKRAGLDLAWDELVQHAEVRRLVGAAVGSVNARLEPHQQIKRWAIAERGFSLEAGEVTESQKLRRHVVIERRAREIEGMYAE